MKDLNKYNTALDLSKLSEDELEFIEYETMQIFTTIQVFKYLFLDYDKYYDNCIYLDDKTNIVDFQTFKQIHFTR